MKNTKIIAAIGFLPILASNGAYADFRDDVGFTQLQSQLGAALPTGAGVNVTQVEASVGTGPTDLVYAPDPNGGQFGNKTIVFPIGATPTQFSSHATGVGQFFYGNDWSMTPGISSIQSYEANAWLSSIETNQVAPTDRRIANHSWAGDGTTNTATATILRYVDRLVYQQQYIQVVAVGNSASPLLDNGFNVIAVGSTAATSGGNTVAVDGTYVAGRAMTDIVAPEPDTSNATPVVSSAAALLVQVGHDGGSTLSTGSTNVNGVGTVYDAERSETVKAALMAGADRATANTSTAANITDYGSAGNTTANGLDVRYGAGQVNIDNSYHIIAAGEQKSGTTIGATGFDYNGSFGGQSGSQRTATYDFTAHGQQSLSASLVWNIGVSNNGSLITTFHHLGLSLVDVTTSTIVTDSSSLLDNTQNIWLTLFDNHQYQLRVSALDASNFSWGYSLAWDVQTVPVPAAVWLFGSALAGFGFFGRKRPGGQA